MTDKEYIGGFVSSGADEFSVIGGQTYAIKGSIMSDLRMKHILWVAFKKANEGEMTVAAVLKKAQELLHVPSAWEYKLVNTFSQAYTDKDHVELANTEGKELEILHKMLYENKSMLETITLSSHVMEHLDPCTEALFNSVKNHFEFIIKTFLVARNEYIDAHHLDDDKNDIEMLDKYWWDILREKGYSNISSAILLFLNISGAASHKRFEAFQGVNNRLSLDISDPKISTEMAEFKKAVEAFHYYGFCKFAISASYRKLMEFPAMAFVKILKHIYPKFVPVDYQGLYTERKAANKDVLKFSEILDKKMRGIEAKIMKGLGKTKAPKDLSQVKLALWYVDAIFDQIFEHAEIYGDIETRVEMLIEVCQKLHVIMKKYGISE